MHLKRQAAITKLPIKRKGTTYVVRASSHVNNAVPVLIAVRDMLGLAKTAKEVEKMIHHKSLKINGELVKTPKDAIQLFDVFHADKSYILSLLPTGKFFLDESKSKEERLCKVTNRRLVNKNKMQINLHDGTNMISSEKIKIGDSVYLDFKNKIVKHLPLEKGKSVFIISGKYIGLQGKLDSVEGKKVKVNLNGKESLLPQEQVVVI